MRKIIVLAAALAVLAGCVAEPKYEVYRKDGQARDIDVDLGQCKAQAGLVSDINLYSSVLHGCMEGKGWFRREVK